MSETGLLEPPRLCLPGERPGPAREEVQSFTRH